MEKRSIALIAGGLTLVAAGIAGSMWPATSATPAQTAAGVFIRNVRVFDGERMLSPTNVLIRDGAIAAIGGSEPPGVEVIPGEGRTLLPGFIDGHTHAFGDALQRALVFGVTTELDMFTDHRFAAAMRTSQRQPDGATDRADLFSAGTLVTAPKGHGTEYGMAIPTLSSPSEAAAFVDARLAEGSDYIKIVYDDGGAFGLAVPTIDRDTLRATIGAARARSTLAVVHIGSRQAAEEAIEAGASGLVHLFADAPASEDLVERIVRAKAFVTPTLSVTESTTGVASGEVLTRDARLSTFLTGAERTALSRSFPRRPTSRQDLSHALRATRRLHEAGVPIIAGTDAPNPGTAHGVSIHRELELLVQAGLTPAAALAAATSVPAGVFAMQDRGRIAEGLRADLVLVTGDPTADITATRDIVAVWKRGVRAKRPEAADEPTAADAATTTGIVSTFEADEPRAEFGLGWQTSTDSLMGGNSQATLRTVKGGANGSARAMEVSGTIAPGAPFPWAGAIFFPGTAPMGAVNLSRFKEIVFWARGDGREHQVMVFASRLGNIPASKAFKPGAEWQEFVMPLSGFSDIDGSDLRGVLFSAGAAPGAFRFIIDEVRFR